MKACFCHSCCNSCFYADACEAYMHDNIIDYPVAQCHGTVAVELCKSRHDFPQTRGAIFPQTIKDPTDTAGMYNIANRALGVFGLDLRKGDTLQVYVTGITPALVEVINWCRDNNVKLVLLNYNKETGGYFEQPVS